MMTMLGAGCAGQIIPSGGGSPFNIDVNAATKSTPFIAGWTDGAFPADVQPAPLWNAAQTDPAYVEVAFASSGTYAVTGDGGTNNNIGSIAMYDQVTDTATGTPAGSPGTPVSFNTGSPGGLYAQAFGSITVASAGTWRVWFDFSLFTYYTLKKLYFTP